MNACKHCGCIMQSSDTECPDCFALDNNFEALCQLCGLFENYDAMCVKCKRKVCASCSLPAVTISPDGKMQDAVKGEVFCWKCNPPGLGPCAERRRHPRSPGPGKRKERNEYGLPYDHNGDLLFDRRHHVVSQGACSLSEGEGGR